MIDGYGWNSGSPLNADNPATNKTDKKHWSERAREGLHKTVDLVAEYGGTVGMSGGAILGIGAGACAIMGNASANEMLASEWFDSSAALAWAGLIKASGSLVAEEAARAFLGKDDAAEIFGPERDSVSEVSPIKGAVAVNDDPTLTPRFQEAVRLTLLNLEDQPESKAALVNLLKKSPEARLAFAEEAGNTKNAVSSSLNLNQAANESGEAHDKGDDPAPR